MAVAGGTAYTAAHDAAAFRRRHERALLRVTGGDRLAWLQGLLTNDVNVVAGGGACDAVWLTPQGRMVTDTTVVETGSFAWLDVPAAIAGTLAQKLDLLIFAEDARVAVDTEATSIGVYGPAAADAVEAALGDAIPAGRLRGLEGQQTAASGDGALIVAVDTSLGVTGLRVHAPAARAAGIEEALAHGGARPLDDDTAEVLRVEAGIPRFLVDASEETIPLEAGLDRLLSQTKGCYVGQEIIVRIRDRAHGRVARRLVGLQLPADAPTPVPGQEVSLDGRPMGRVTSAVRSPARDCPIALAMLHREATEPGTLVTLEGGTRAEVTTLPFRT